MTQLEITRIKKVFTEKYFDLGIYRWLNRNKNILKTIFGVSFISVFIIALFWSSWPLMFWAFSFIGFITIGGLDHLIIGISLNKILKKLESQDIKISRNYLLEICQDIIPQ